MYRLEGFDAEWNYVGDRRMAYYTNLPPGKYVFRVRGSNNDEVWNEAGASVAIRVLPPFWATGWAFLLYAVVAGGALMFVVYHTRQKHKLEEAVLREKLQAEAREEFHAERSKLFTNFSHELRSPLTLIMSPLERILNGRDHAPELRGSLLLMYDNARRLLRIVNNLLDFTKREYGKLRLRVAEENMTEFAREMFLIFNELAACRGIDFQFVANDATGPMWFDRSLMEKVFFNLLSNAFKNTPNNGQITLRLTVCSRAGLEGQGITPENGQVGDRFLVVDVQDSGSGVRPEERRKIFTPFYQVVQNEHANSGTGLGLSLTKSIVELHRGCCWVEDAPRYGALFRCLLPIGKAWFGADEMMDEHPASYVPAESCIAFREEDAVSPPEGSYTILVVEDNADMRRYIASCLGLHYRVKSVASAEQALRHITADPPDLVISDLMMAGMDGLDMCRRLKGQEETAHIPIIMLTARTSVMDIRTGYESGVDDYVTKPFNALVLQARVKNLLEGRRTLKRFYGKDFSLTTLGIEVSGSDDERLLQRLYGIITANLINSGLNLYDYCQDLGMSRANLYRKIKSITGLSPSEFVRNFRIETAAKLLRESKMPVSEISVIVGFSSLAYFSTSFKTVYGLSPSRYQSQNAE